jgi:DNA-binding MarR family transcriptional regulator
MVERFADRLGEVGLKPHTFVTLLHLSRGQALTSAELSRRLEMTPQSMSTLLRGMAEHGLVTRPGGMRRGQRIEVRLTDLGWAALERARPALHRMADPAEMGLTAGEAATLRGLLERVIAALTGESLTAGPGRGPSDD